MVSLVSIRVMQQWCWETIEAWKLGARRMNADGSLRTETALRPTDHVLLLCADHHCVTRPSFWPIVISRLFIRDHFFRCQYQDFFSAIDTDTFFQDQIFPYQYQEFFPRPNFTTPRLFPGPIFFNTDSKTLKTLSWVSRLRLRLLNVLGN